MSPIKNAVILAAGIGSRLGLNTPKCMLDIGGVTLIDRQLSLLESFEDVRVVVGFDENKVMDHVSKRWPNVTFVRNPGFANGSNFDSLFLGTRYLKEPVIIIDGDLLINRLSFDEFLEYCNEVKDSVIGVTARKSEDAVGVYIDNGFVHSFVSKNENNYRNTQYEWTGIACVKDLGAITINKKIKYVYQIFERYLPLPTKVIQCHEIDTPFDLDRARENIKLYL